MTVWRCAAPCSCDTSRSCGSSCRRSWVVGRGRPACGSCETGALRGWHRLHELLLARLTGAGLIDWSRAAVDGSHVRALKGWSGHPAGGEVTGERSRCHPAHQLIDAIPPVGRHVVHRSADRTSCTPTTAPGSAATGGWWWNRSTRCCPGSGGRASAERSATTSTKPCSPGCAFICWRRLTPRKSRSSKAVAQCKLRMGRRQALAQRTTYSSLGSHRLTAVVNALVAASSATLRSPNCLVSRHYPGRSCWCACVSVEQLSRVVDRVVLRVLR